MARFITLFPYNTFLMTATELLKQSEVYAPDIGILQHRQLAAAASLQWNACKYVPAAAALLI